ncbi:hypothetical protein FSP39_003699 [Pinctada imbricata]|uniref:Chitin-binding type-4 domain-containing protein n=1 Tax=Pinctada imbricata TaxID=66713 RepID=A0AA89BXY9_PINIB|nr:hypothetical protein FSP39_003699 [Pinctada imbricata]
MTRSFLQHITLVGGVISFLCRGVASHGRLIEPPGRSTMWRYGFDTPVNYNDNQLFCGGKSHQYNVNGGKCGVCGDPYDGARENEAGGKYATGTISRCYNNTPSPLVVRVHITANHLGYFEFRLCPHDNTSTPVEQECLDQHLLKLYGSEDTRYHIGSDVRVYEVQLYIPENITCRQCVLQWKYNTGNSWGCDGNGECGMGLGQQEQFYGCADISIGVDCNSLSTTSTQPSSSTYQAADSTTASTFISDSTVSTSTSSGRSSTSDATTRDQNATNSYSSSTLARNSSSTTPSVGNLNCRAAGAFKGQQTINQWCRANCAIGYCPATHCECVERTSISSSTSSTTTASLSSLSSSSKLTTANELTTLGTPTKTASVSDESTNSNPLQSTQSSTSSHSLNPSTTTQLIQPSVASTLLSILLTTNENTEPTTEQTTTKGTTDSTTLKEQSTETSTKHSTETSTQLTTLKEQSTETSTKHSTETSTQLTTLKEQSKGTSTKSTTEEEHSTETSAQLTTQKEHSTVTSTQSTTQKEQSTETSSQSTTQKEQSTVTNTQSTTQRIQTTTEDSQTQSQSCVPTSVYSSVAGMQAWCETNCQQGYCPATHCICT